MFCERADEMIIWSGMGYLVLILGFGSLLMTEVVLESIFADETYYQAHGWPKLLGFVIAGILVWFLGNFLNTADSKKIRDPETGKKMIVRGDHTLFFIPMEYWGPIFLILGFIFLFNVTTGN